MKIPTPTTNILPTAKLSAKGPSSAANASHLGTKTVAVLDVGTAKTCVFIARMKVGAQQALPFSAANARSTIEITGWAVTASSGIEDGAVADRKKAAHMMSAAIHHAEHKAGCSINQIAVPVGCGRVRSEVFAVDTPLDQGTAGAQALIAARAEAQNMVLAAGNMPLHLVALSFQVDDGPQSEHVPVEAGQILRTVFHVVVTDAAPAELLRQTIQDIGLEPHFLASMPYASAVAVLRPEEAGSRAICIDLGAGTTSLAAFSGGNLIYTDTLAVGGGHLSQDIAAAFEISLAQAEHIKLALPDLLEHTPVEEAEAQLHAILAVIQPRIIDLFETLDSRMTRHGLPALACSPVVLTGGGAHLVGLINMAQSALKGGSFEIRDPKRFKGFADFSCGAAFSAAHGLLRLKQEDANTMPGRKGGGQIPTGDTYAVKMGRWLRENF